MRHAVGTDLRTTRHLLTGGQLDARADPGQGGRLASCPGPGHKVHVYQTRRRCRSKVAADAVKKPEVFVPQTSFRRTPLLLAVQADAETFEPVQDVPADVEERCRVPLRVRDGQQRSDGDNESFALFSTYLAIRGRRLRNDIVEAISFKRLQMFVECRGHPLT